MEFNFACAKRRRLSNSASQIWQMILRAGERGDAAFLRERSRVARAVALHGVNRLGNRLRRGEKTQPPAGHAPRLGEAVNDDGVLVMRRRKTGDALHLRAIVKQMLVNLVAHDEDVFLHADVAERLGFLRRINGAGRIARRIQDEQPRVRRDGGAQLRGRDFEFRLVRRLQNHRLRARELHHFRIAQPIRRGDDDFVAFLAGGEDDVVAGMFAAAGHDDLRRFVSQAVLAFEFVGDGLAQFRDAAGWACIW